MKGLLVFLGLLVLFSGSAEAQERAFTLDGRLVELKADGTYQVVAGDNPKGMVVFSLSGGQQTGKKCVLEATLQNNTAFTVQHLKQCFKVFAKRGGETVCFRFGGGSKSDQIKPESSATATANFKKGRCDAITGAEPYFLFNGRDPSDVNLAGLAPYDARKLFHFSKAGVIPIGNLR